MYVCIYIYMYACIYIYHFCAIYKGFWSHFNKIVLFHLGASWLFLWYNVQCRVFVTANVKQQNRSSPHDITTQKQGKSRTDAYHHMARGLIKRCLQVSMWSFKCYPHGPEDGSLKCSEGISRNRNPAIRISFDSWCKSSGWTASITRSCSCSCPHGFGDGALARHLQPATWLYGSQRVPGFPYSQCQCCWYGKPGLGVTK